MNNIYLTGLNKYNEWCESRKFVLRFGLPRRPPEDFHFGKSRITIKTLRRVIYIPLGYSDIIPGVYNSESDLI